MTSEPASAGDEIPPECGIIEVRVAELRQLFNAIDPSPFRERDLDPRAEEFIVGWSRELPSGSRVALLVHLERSAGMPGEVATLREAIHEFFGQRADASRRSLRELFRRGRVSLAIGLAFVASSIAIGDALVSHYRNDLAEIVRESLLIGGWVAMWRPLEIFLYDWWPIRADARRFDRLSAMPVRIVYRAQAPPEAWRSDWPAARASEASAGASERRLADGTAQAEARESRTGSRSG